MYDFFTFRSILSVQVPFIPRFHKDLEGASQQILYFDIFRQDRQEKAGHEAWVIRSDRDIWGITTMEFQFHQSNSYNAPCLLFPIPQKAFT